MNKDQEGINKNLLNILYFKFKIKILITIFRALNLTRKVEKESSPKNTFKKLIKSDKYVYLQPVCIVLNKEVLLIN